MRAVAARWDPCVRIGPEWKAGGRVESGNVQSSGSGKWGRASAGEERRRVGAPEAPGHPGPGSRLISANPHTQN